MAEILLISNHKETTSILTYSTESTEDLKSVLAGGMVQGWMPDNAVVLWRRMLGSLGNINKIADAENHATVHEELSYLLETLNRVGHKKSFKL